MTTTSCERCGYTASTDSLESTGCRRCAERAVRSQLRRVAARQAGHVRSLRTRADAAASPQKP